MEIEKVSISDLKSAPFNPRTHPDKAVERLVKSIEEFGWTNPVLVQKGTNLVLAGHARIKAAEKIGIKEIPVIYLDLDDARAKAYNIADNRTAELTEWDFPKLKDLIAEIDTGELDIEITGFDEVELKEIFDFEMSDFGKIEKELDENIETKNECPSCGYAW